MPWQQDQSVLATLMDLSVDGEQVKRAIAKHMPNLGDRRKANAKAKTKAKAKGK